MKDRLRKDSGTALQQDFVGAPALRPQNAPASILNPNRENKTIMIEHSKVACREASRQSNHHVRGDGKCSHALHVAASSDYTAPDRG
jgi:hypothetical protein